MGLAEESIQISISRDGKILGTWSKADIKRMFDQGELLPTDSYWHEGMREWKRIFPSKPSPASAPTGQSDQPTLTAIPPLLARVTDLSKVDELWGVCPVCQTNRWFRDLKFTEVVSDLWGFLKQHGVKGTAGQLLNEAARGSTGAKPAYTFVCTTCKTRFQICGHCIRPNVEQAERARCDYCHGSLIV